MVGKVELIFACALHSISVFFYLLIFNVRPHTAALAATSHARNPGMGDERMLCRWMSRRCGSRSRRACWALCLFLETAFAICMRRSSSSSWSTRAPNPKPLNTSPWCTVQRRHAHRQAHHMLLSAWECTGYYVR